MESGFMKMAHFYYLFLYMIMQWTNFLQTKAYFIFFLLQTSINALIATKENNHIISHV